MKPQGKHRTRCAASFILIAASCPSSDLFFPHEEALLEATRSSAQPDSCPSPDLFFPCKGALLEEESGSCLPLQAMLEQPDDIFSYLFTANYMTPDKIAVVAGALSLTYAQLFARAQALAGAFVRLGVEKHGRVGVMLANGVSVLDVHFAAAASRLVVVNLNTHLAAPELAYMLHSSAPEMLVMDVEFAPLLLRALSEESAWSPVHASVQEASSPMPCSLRSVLWVGGCPDSALIECLRTFGVSSSLVFEDLVSHTDASPFAMRDLPPRSPDDPYMLYFTSGTTGLPKMVQLSHRVVATHARGTVREMRLHDSDVWLHVAPMFHLVDAFAIYAVTLVGGRHVIMRSFAAIDTLRCIERERVTVTNMASTMALLCVNSPGAPLADLSSLRMLSCGGSPLPAAAVRRALSVFGTEFCLSYGMSELWCAQRGLLPLLVSDWLLLLMRASRACPSVARFR